MAIHYDIFPEHGLISMVYDKALTVDQIVNVCRDCVNDPLFRPDLDVLEIHDGVFFDGTYSDVCNLTRRMNDWYTARLPTARSALIAPGDVEFGMARMYQMTADRACQSPIDVFRTVPEGLAFLDKAYLDPGIFTAVSDVSQVA